MADEDPKPGDVRADEDPKPGDVRADEDPKPGDVRGASPVNPFGGSAGWGIVAFVGPVGLNVPELALRALRAKGPERGGRRSKALGKVFALAENAAHKQVLDRVKVEKQAKAEQYQKELFERLKGKTQT